MMAWDVVVCRPAHIRAIHAQPAQALAGEAFDVWAESGGAAILEALGRTIVAGRPIAAYGLVPVHADVYAAWGLFSDEALKRPIALARTVREGIEDAIEATRARRIESTFPVRHREAERWHRFLGFLPEGVLHRRGDGGEDVWMYARLP